MNNLRGNCPFNTNNLEEPHVILYIMPLFILGYMSYMIYNKQQFNDE